VYDKARVAYPICGLIHPSSLASFPSTTMQHAQQQLNTNEFQSTDPAWIAEQKGIFSRWFNVMLLRARSARTTTGKLPYSIAPYCVVTILFVLTFLTFFEGPTLLHDLTDGVILLQILQVLYPSIHLPRWFGE
jgi:hypothetical protein